MTAPLDSPAPHVHRCAKCDTDSGHRTNCTCSCGAVQVGDAWIRQSPRTAPTREAADTLSPQVRAALEDARHSLVTLCGLYASDNLGIYSDAMRDGCDPSGAWDVFVESMFSIDEAETIAKLDAAMSATEQEGE